MGWIRTRRRAKTYNEDEKMARLENAERDVADLVSRADRAITFLDARHHRNHWRESIEQMIQGRA